MYLLGIDGGGTKTRIVLLNELGELLGSGVGGASSIRSVSNETTLNSFKEAYKKAIKNTPNIKLDAVFAGLGDIETKEDQELVKGFIKDLEGVTENTKLTVRSDAFNALYGGLGSHTTGVSIILGTGSVALGINELGQTKRVGGYSYKEGDPGSSYYLGKLCLSYAAKVLDGRKEPSNFSKALLKELNVTDRVSYIHMIDEYHEDRSKTAQLAKLVTKYSVLGDLDAFDIAYDGLTGAVELVDACAKGLKLKDLNVAVIGSLGNSDFYFTALQKSLSAVNPHYKVFSNILDPSLGAGIGALKSMKIKITKDVLNNLKKINI